MKSSIQSKGETGIGTLIIFISVVLVAAIAAGVLIGTAGSLQQRSLTTGKQTEKEVSSGLNVITISAEDGSDSDLEEFSLLMKLTSGADPTSFDSILVTFDTKNSTQRLYYNSSGGTSSTTFNASYPKRGPDSRDGYISTGDVIEISFNSSRPISEAEALRIRIIPKYGVIVPLDFVVPDYITQRRVILYP